MASPDPQPPAKKHRDWFDKAMLATSIGAMLFAGAAAIAAIVLSMQTQRSLNDARVAASQAHLDNVNSLGAADAALTASNSTGDTQAGQTNDALAIAANTADAAGTSAAASKLSAGALSGQLAEMQSEQRPWVKAEVVEPTKSIHPFIPDGLRSMNPDAKLTSTEFLAIHVSARNVGHSPAFNVRVGLWPIYGYAQRLTDVLGFEEKNCASLEHTVKLPMLADNQGFAPIMYPGDSYPFDEAALGLRPEDFRKYLDGNGRFQLWFEGCIVYNLPGSSAPHRTIFVYRLGHLVPTPNGPAVDESFEPGEEVPAAALYLEPKPLAVPVPD